MDQPTPSSTSFLDAFVSLVISGWFLLISISIEDVEHVMKIVSYGATTGAAVISAILAIKSFKKKNK